MEIRQAMTDVRTSSPPRVRNRTYHVLGAAALAANKLRYAILGYHRPRNFSSSEIDRCVQYDFQVVENWMAYLNAYLGKPVEISGKNILEPGPGQDLGIGLILLSRGACKYNAIDAYNLLSQSTEQFYTHLFRRFEKNGCDKTIIEELHRQLEQTQSGQNDRLNYIYRKDFDLSVLDGEGVDFVFSQAAFEHFDDTGRTIEQLNRVVRPGAVFLAVIDLQTHTRRFREQDPLNIYRYSEFYYRLCRYAGQPNRLRPVEYHKILADNGWENIRIQPLDVLGAGYIRRVQPGLNKRFRAENGQMEYLTVVICATKA